MSSSEASEVLPTFESLGYRLIVRSALPAVVRGLFVGTVAPDAPPTAATIERLEWWLEDDFVAREVALIDPVDDAVRGRFRTQNRVRGCCSLGDDRCLYVEGRAIVSRTVTGDDRRVHCAEAFGEEESPTDHPVSDGRVALLGVVGEDERASVRVIALDGAGDVRSIELGARPMALGFNGSNIIVQTWNEPGDGELRAFDRETLAPRWSVQCESPWDELVCVGAVVATDAEAAPFGQRPIIARVDQRMAAIDPRDGSVRFEQTEETPSLFEGDAMGADRVALWASVGELEVRSVLERAVLARFALREPLSEARAMPGLRWAVLSGRQLVLCDAAPGAVLAGALLPRNGALVLTGDRWIAVVTEACEPNQHQPLLRSRAMRAVDPWADAPAVRVPMSDALLAIEEPADARALAVDPARIDAILHIAEDERWNDGASWERLVAQGLVDEGFDRGARRVEGTFSGALLAGPLDRSLEDAASRAVWLALAHDAPRLVTALALAREFTVRIRPFCVEPVDRVVLRADATMTSGFDPGVLGFAMATLDVAARWDPPPVYGNFYRWLCERDALWSIAAERGVRMPSTAPSSLLGRSFSDALSPFAPLIALYELGVPPLSIGSDALALRLWPIEGRSRAARWDDDIPF
jgi:hypothetical protein